MKIRNLFVTAMTMVLLGLGVLSGCTSKPTTGDLMRGHASELEQRGQVKKQLSNDWKKGKKLVSRGEKRVKDGEKQVERAESSLKKGQDAIQRGRREVAEGQKLIHESEGRFRTDFPDLEIGTRR